MYNVKSGESGRSVTVYRFAGKLTSGSGGDENSVSARYLYYFMYIYIYIPTNTHHRYTTSLGYPSRKVPSRLHPCQQSRLLLTRTGSLISDLRAHTRFVLISLSPYNIHIYIYLVRYTVQVIVYNIYARLRYITLINLRN